VTIEFSKLNPPVITPSTPNTLIPNTSTTRPLYTVLGPLRPHAFAHRHFGSTVIPNTTPTPTTPNAPKTITLTNTTTHPLKVYNHLKYSGNRTIEGPMQRKQIHTHTHKHNYSNVFDHKGLGKLRTLAICQKLSSNAHRSLRQFGISNYILLSLVYRHNRYIK